MLTDTQCRAAKCPADKKRARLTDAHGLYLEVSPGGSKRWFQRLKFGGVDTRIALGSYPAVSLADARRKQADVKAQRAQKLNPIEERRKAQQQQARGDTFATVAEEWFAKQLASSAWVDGGKRIRHFLSDLLPTLGARPMQEIEAPELLAVLKKTAQRGALDTARRELTMTGQIWRYGIQTGRVTRDIAADLKGDALPTPIKRNMAAVTTPQALAPMLRAIRTYAGKNAFLPIVPTALQLAPMLFQRPLNLRQMRWGQIDWKTATWTIPSAEMKRSREAKLNGAPHIVPLPRQAIALLEALRAETDKPGRGGWVFPGGRQRDRSISDGTMNMALIACNVPRDVQSIHGFRATARTILSEVLEYEPWVIEAQLAHEVKDANGRAYNRTQFLKQRRAMMQVWADYLDALAEGVEPERAAEIARAAKGEAQQ